MPRIYVGTYKKYTEGSLKGAWLDLEDYNNKKQFLKACYQLHDDEDDPELMFQDVEGVPGVFYTECSIEPEFWDYLCSDIENGVKEAYMELFDTWDEDDCLSRYEGEFDNYEKLAEHLLDSQGFFEKIPDGIRQTVEYHFNFESYGRDLKCSGDFDESNHHYFCRN